MKTIKKMSVALIIVSLIVIVISSSAVFASDIMNNINRLANESTDGNIVNSASEIAGTIITVAQVICSGVAVAMLTVLGIKYMSSSAGDKATIKKHAVVYVVGAIVMFASTGILEIIQSFAAGI